MLFPLPLLNCNGIVSIAVISKCSWRFWFACPGFGKKLLWIGQMPGRSCCSCSLYHKPSECPIAMTRSVFFHSYAKKKNSSFWTLVTWLSQLLWCSLWNSHVFLFLPIQWRPWNLVPVNDQNTPVVDSTEDFVFIALFDVLNFRVYQHRYISA